MAIFTKVFTQNVHGLTSKTVSSVFKEFSFIVSCTTFMLLSFITSAQVFTQNIQTLNPSATVISETVSPSYANSESKLIILNRKANLLLSELRLLLKDSEKESKFREGIGPAIVEKASLLFPRINLKELLFGADQSSNVQLQELNDLSHLIELLDAAILELN